MGLGYVFGENSSFEENDNRVLCFSFPLLPFTKDVAAIDFVQEVTLELNTFY